MKSFSLEVIIILIILAVIFVALASWMFALSERTQQKSRFLRGFFYAMGNSASTIAGAILLGLFVLSILPSKINDAIRNVNSI